MCASCPGLLPSTHPVPLVLLGAAGTVRLHAVLVLGWAAGLVQQAGAVGERHGLVLYRLTHTQQQLRQLGNIAT